MRRKTWVKFPTHWIEAHRLKELRWEKGEGSSAAAALMVLIVLAHNMDDQTGLPRVTYDALCEATGLSRTKVSHGLRRLESMDLIRRPPNQNSIYEIVGYSPDRGWGKLPCHGLYRANQIVAFQPFRLRSRTELDALKLYLLFVSRRDNDLNAAQISYEKIEDFSGINRNRIKSAVSVLIFHHLVNVESQASTSSLFGQAHIYRLTHIDPRYDPDAVFGEKKIEKELDKVPF
jgi:DNA-binding transcriptional ArsR family regulator